MYLQHLEAIELGNMNITDLLEELVRYEPAEIAADGLPELCTAVFEAYVETCDAMDLCFKIREMTEKKLDMDDGGRQGLMHAVEDLELSVRSCW